MLRVEGESGSAYGARLLIEEPRRAGQLIHQVTAPTVRSTPNVYSIQTGPHTHVDDLGPVSFINHSCDPNTVFDAEAIALRAIRDVEPGDELTFFYPSTEWDMHHPFVCRCGAPQCVRLVAGAKYLSADVLGRYYINPHVRDLLLQALAPASPALNGVAR
jgi:hypothetical protein